jgi:hypothetical protein
MHFFRTQPVVTALASGSFSAEQYAYYLLAGFLLWNVASYTGLVTAGTSPWTFPYVAEFLAVVLINIVGVVTTFDAAGGKTSRQYVLDFTCLYVPVSVTTLLAFWGVYWIIQIGFRETIMIAAQSDMQFALNMSKLGFDAMSFLAFIATVGSLAVTYYRMAKLLAHVRAVRGEA